MSQSVGDNKSILFSGLSGFWLKFFADTPDLIAYYQASEEYIAQTYLDLMSTCLNLGIVDTPIFNKEVWKLYTVKETDLRFVAGPSSTFDRYWYDLPGDAVSVPVLQNSIFSPQVLLESGVDFDVINNDGFLRFRTDLFREFQDTDGNYYPRRGIAWRSVPSAVGNQLTDRRYAYHSGGNPYTDGVRTGDTLRLLASIAKEATGSGTSGSMVYSSPDYIFTGSGVGAARIGDVIQVSGHAGLPGDPDDVFLGYYVVKEVVDSNNVYLEESSAGIPSLSSVQPLTWSLYPATYLGQWQDLEVDYLEGSYCIGPAGNPYPVEAYENIVYSIVRDTPEPDVYGIPLNTPAVHTWPVPVLAAPVVTVLNVRHVIPGSVIVYGRKYLDSGQQADVEEGVDYTIDYLRGIIYQLTYWVPGSIGRCDFSYQAEVYLSGGGQFSARSQGNVRQIAYWVPTVYVDRFTLYYNYGSLLNRFAASSEQYRTFLRGVMRLYMSGPILERIESAMNLIANYPVIAQDGEVLLSYDNGITATGTAGSLDGTNDTIAIPVSEYTFTYLDEGGVIVISDALNDRNTGAFLITAVDTITNTLTLRNSVGFATESPVSWVYSREYAKKVTTDNNVYVYPFNVPIRPDVQNPANYNVLLFSVFESLTDAFVVTDYLEDPNWWNNKYIPRVLWDEPDRARRLVTTQLYENIIGAPDNPRIGDPGFYIGADSQGNVVSPMDQTGLVPVPSYRQSAAFILFDQILKMHMFYVSIAPDLKLDSLFEDDLRNIVMVSKPSYTYPYVEAGGEFEDVVSLEDLFNITGISFYLGGEAAEYPESMILPDTSLVIGDPSNPWSIGDMFRYGEAAGVAVPGAPDPVISGTAFIVPGVPSGAVLLELNVNATVGGVPVIEGTDYTVEWLVEKPFGTPNPDMFRIIALTNWDSTTLTVTYQYAERLNGSYDTLLGWTPILIGGVSPWYIRTGALDPSSPTYLGEWAALRTEHIDRTIQLTIDDNGSSYVYP